ncbi:MAG: hypothetical protein ACI9TV_002860 [Sulfurimonas sp.]|jgi:hypothetical protein|uniref:hypothetical protein n=1 Tax=Sulfurimonas sp. TaxID=2022749 RepID=UPI0039E3A416
MMQMREVQVSDNGISEYDLSAYLCKEFKIKLEDESFYLEYFKSFSVENMDGVLQIKFRENTPYQECFNTGNSKILFLDETSSNFKMDTDFFLLTPKSAKSLNSQFKREKNVYINTSHGFENGEVITISSAIGSVNLKVEISTNLRNDCVLIYSGTLGVNNLTSSKHSY